MMKLRGTRVNNRPYKKKTGKDDGETLWIRQLEVNYKVKGDCDDNVDDKLASMIDQLFKEGLNDALSINCYKGSKG